MEYVYTIYMISFVDIGNMLFEHPKHVVRLLRSSWCFEQRALDLSRWCATSSSVLGVFEQHAPVLRITCLWITFTFVY